MDIFCSVVPHSFTSVTSEPLFEHQRPSSCPTGAEGAPHAVAEVAREELRRGLTCCKGQPDGHALLTPPWRPPPRGTRSAHGAHPPSWSSSLTRSSAYVIPHRSMTARRQPGRSAAPHRRVLTRISWHFTHRRHSSSCQFSWASPKQHSGSWKVSFQTPSHIESMECNLSKLELRAWQSHGHVMKKNFNHVDLIPVLLHSICILM